MSRLGGWVDVQASCQAFWWATAAILATMAGCDEDAAGAGPCVVDTDCPPGQGCLSGQCVVAIDSGRPPPYVDPPDMDAGRPDAGPGPVDPDSGTSGCQSTATCEDLGAECGLVHDGCAFIECGDCTDPETCGGGGVPNECGAGVCTATTTCPSAGAECGFIDDGCENTLDCGTCGPDESCGGGGVPNKCGRGGAPFCTPSNCKALGAECGPVGDGCGGFLHCGTCDNGETCGGGGEPNHCGGGATCIPTTCEQLGANCGDIGDGCGGTLRCGFCPPFYNCNANRCSCDADTCGSLQAECGMGIPDGCGRILNCGTCTAPETCGGAGTPNQCGCTKRIVATEWKNGVTFFSTSSWRNADFARAHDNQYAIFSFHHMCHGDNGGGGQIGPYTRTSNHLDLRGYDIQVPAGTKLTGIEARVKQSGGRLVEAVIFTARGPTANLGNGRVAGGFHYFGGPNNLFGKELTAEHTRTRGHWGLSMRAEATAPRSPCPRTEGISRVDVIQFRAHYEICD